MKDNLQNAGHVVMCLIKSIRTLYFSISCLLLIVFNTVYADTSLPTEVHSILKKHKLPASSMSVYIKEINSAAPEPLIDYQSSIARNPASVMKLVTTLAGLELLGPAYHWETNFYYDGALSNNVLQGNLVLKGGADPFFTREDLWHSLFSLQSKGLKHIKGHLIIDRNAIEPESGHPGQFDNKPYRAYNAFPDAALLNFTAQQFIFLPQKQTVAIYSDPASSNLEIRNKLKLVDGKCRGLTQAVNMQVIHQGLKTIAEFKGNYPKRCGERNLLRSITNNSVFTYGVFKSMWETMGGTIEGTIKHGLHSKTSLFLHKHQSQPLSNIIELINKFSNNVMARQLLLTIAKEKFGEPGTKRNAQTVIEQWLTQKGISTKNVIIDNGAGLSRSARFDALALGKLLELAYRSPLRPEFLSSLSIAGVDGTMRKRFKNSIPAGTMRIKTGLLNDVRSMAGYVTTKKGKEYVVVSFQNHPGVQNWTGTEVQDVLLKWLYHNH